MSHHDRHNHDHAHNHDHDHAHNHDIYSEDGLEPVVVSIKRELPGATFSTDELVLLAEGMVCLIATFFTCQKCLIGHIKLQILANEDCGLFISGTSPENVNVKKSEGFGDEGFSVPDSYELGLTTIVFGMPNIVVSKTLEGLMDGFITFQKK